MERKLRPLFYSPSNRWLKPKGNLAYSECSEYGRQEVLLASMLVPRSTAACGRSEAMLTGR